MPTPDEIRDNQRKAWSAAAAGWERSADWYGRNFAAAFEGLCRGAGAAPGKRLLDVACGAGQPALRLAALAGPPGSVVAIDLSSEMLAVAARQARAAGLYNLEFLQMGAESLGFPDGSFDGISCGFALMFCPDPVRAAAEMRRVLVPGGRVAVVVWDQLSLCPYLKTLFAAVSQFFPPAPPADPKAPGGFRLSPPGELEAVLQAAGLSDVGVESLPLELEFSSLEEYWQMTLDQAAGLRGRLDTLAEAERARLGEVMREALLPFTTDGRIRIGARVLLGTGTRR